MTVYIAGPYQTKAECRAIAETLEGAGYEVTSRWLYDSQEDSEEAAIVDIVDIERAGALLLYHPAEWAGRGTGGRHVEFGYALARGKRLVILGRAASNVFHLLSAVERVDTVEEAFPCLT
jgi:hypothetical protein